MLLDRAGRTKEERSDRRSVAIGSDSARRSVADLVGGSSVGWNAGVEISGLKGNVHVAQELVAFYNFPAIPLITSTKWSI